MAAELEKIPKSAGIGAIGFERTIQSLLLKFGNEHEKITAELKAIILNKAPGSLAEWQSVSLFFIHSGQQTELIELLKSEIGKNPLFPWAHFAEALHLCLSNPPEDLIQAIIAGAKEKECLEILSRVKHFDTLDPALKRKRAERKKRFDDRYEEQKRDWLGQLETIRSQGLDAEEEQMLQKLLKTYPRDSNVIDLMEVFQAKKALRFLEEKSLRRKTEEKEEAPLRIEEDLLEAADQLHASMLEAWQQHDEAIWLGRDFALASLWSELLEQGLEFVPPEQLDHSSAGDSAVWIRCELLLRARRFLDLLDELNLWEARAADSPDQVVGILYLRAQALYGMGQKILAIELMETIVTNHPSYRSASTLLNTWKLVYR